MVTVASVPAAAVPVRSLSDRVIALLRRIDYRRADTLEEKEAIFKLRYAAYLREGAIPPNASERFCDALDNTDNAWIFGIYVEGELVREPLNNTRLGFCCLWSGFLPQWRTSSSGCLASRGRFGPCLCHADASVLRARNRLASASSANTCAPFLAMPR
jgi:hypothetical protein